MILTIVGLTVLAACGNDDTTTAPETDANSDQEQTAPAPLYELVENQSIPASDLSAIPANAVQRGNTVVATLLEPSGLPASTPKPFTTLMTPLSSFTSQK